ncbi:hypothetical protein O3M35_010104 [Rhynocoris fuscipes]|uniref:Uncharacterized protein n=1 Tax=Rhynocoris fuscipes TaxID=488301 RepID=A0AAW1D0J2_9HEMI
MKSALKGTRFESVEAVKEKASWVLKELTEKDFQHCFEQWKILIERCRVRGEVTTVDTICTSLPKPLNKVGVCLEACNESIIGLPQEAAICLCTELSLIFPLISIDLNRLNYEKGKGIFFDWNIESESKALIYIKINGGKPIVSFNSLIPYELVKPVLSAIQSERQKLIEL